MSEWNAGYYGSGLRLNEEEFMSFFNVPYVIVDEEKSKNPEFVDWIDLRSETSYMVFCDRDLDGPMSFVKKPYDSYEDFVDEFRRKMGQYLPEDFDWDAHIGRINYSAYC